MASNDDEEDISTAGAESGGLFNPFAPSPEEGVGGGTSTTPLSSIPGSFPVSTPPPTSPPPPIFVFPSPPPSATPLTPTIARPPSATPPTPTIARPPSATSLTRPPSRPKQPSGSLSIMLGESFRTGQKEEFLRLVNEAKGKTKRDAEQLIQKASNGVTQEFFLVIQRCVQELKAKGDLLEILKTMATDGRFDNKVEEIRNILGTESERDLQGQNATIDELMKSLKTKDATIQKMVQEIRLLKENGRGAGSTSVDSDKRVKQLELQIEEFQSIPSDYHVVNNPRLVEVLTALKGMRNDRDGVNISLLALEYYISPFDLSSTVFFEEGMNAIAAQYQLLSLWKFLQHMQYPASMSTFLEYALVRFRDFLLRVLPPPRSKDNEEEGKSWFQNVLNNDGLTQAIQDITKGLSGTDSIKDRSMPRKIVDRLNDLHNTLIRSINPSDPTDEKQREAQGLILAFYPLLDPSIKAKLDEIEKTKPNLLEFREAVLDEEEDESDEEEEEDELPQETLSSAPFFSFGSKPTSFSPPPQSLREPFTPLFGGDQSSSDEDEGEGDLPLESDTGGGGSLFSAFSSGFPITSSSSSSQSSQTSPLVLSSLAIDPTNWYSAIDNMIQGVEQRLKALYGNRKLDEVDAQRIQDARNYDNLYGGHYSTLVGQDCFGGSPPFDIPSLSLDDVKELLGYNSTDVRTDRLDVLWDDVKPSKEKPQSQTGNPQETITESAKVLRPMIDFDGFLELVKGRKSEDPFRARTKSLPGPQQGLLLGFIEAFQAQNLYDKIPDNSGLKCPYPLKSKVLKFLVTLRASFPKTWATILVKGLLMMGESIDTLSPVSSSTGATTRENVLISNPVLVTSLIESLMFNFYSPQLDTIDYRIDTTNGFRIQNDPNDDTYSSGLMYYFYTLYLAPMLREFNDWIASVSTGFNQGIKKYRPVQTQPSSSPSGNDLVDVIHDERRNVSLKEQAVLKLWSWSRYVSQRFFGILPASDKFKQKSYMDSFKNRFFPVFDYLLYSQDNSKNVRIQGASINEFLISTNVNSVLEAYRNSVSTYLGLLPLPQLKLDDMVATNQQTKDAIGQQSYVAFRGVANLNQSERDGEGKSSLPGLKFLTNLQQKTSRTIARLTAGLAGVGGTGDEEQRNRYIVTDFEEKVVRTHPDNRPEDEYHFELQDKLAKASLPPASPPSVTEISENTEIITDAVRYSDQMRSAFGIEDGSTLGGVGGPSKESVQKMVGETVANVMMEFLGLLDACDDLVKIIPADKRKGRAIFLNSDREGALTGKFVDFFKNSFLEKIELVGTDLGATGMSFSSENLRKSLYGLLASENDRTDVFAKGDRSKKNSKPNTPLTQIRWMEVKILESILTGSHKVFGEKRDIELRLERANVKNTATFGKLTGTNGLESIVSRGKEDRNDHPDSTEASSTVLKLSQELTESTNLSIEDSYTKMQEIGRIMLRESRKPECGGKADFEKAKVLLMSSPRLIDLAKREKKFFGLRQVAINKLTLCTSC